MIEEKDTLLKNNDKHTQSGFTLVELAIVVVVAGIAGFAIINAYSTLAKNIQRNKTQLHLTMIQNALAAYVNRNMRLPCPMNPAFAAMTPPMGYEAGSGANGDIIPANCPVIEGIVPYKTLSLPAEMARDGDGSYITYRIARSHGRDQRNFALIHQNCRGVMWMERPMNTPVGTVQNINPELARFCCRGTEGGVNDLDVEIRPQTTAALQNVWTLPVDNGGARYAIDSIESLPPDHLPSSASNRNTIRPIYVLVSHGANGTGAFREDGSGNRNAGFLGTDEATNANTASSQFATYEPVLLQNDATYFDDRLAWGTQDTLLAKSGRFSCHAPSRD
jgi:prepilin-type N-terminal cleavage/methylation domain-containing protein